MPSCVTYVTKEHFTLVKRALAYLAVSLKKIQGKKTEGEKRQTNKRTCLYVRVLETGDWDLFLGPLEWARAETGGADQWVL